jgi:hypothetical protein
MIKYCPFMSFRTEKIEGIYCMDDSCALYDEERRQCCMLTQALAAAAKPSVTPVVFQPSVHTAPAVVPNGTGDWVEPNPYTITCETKSEKDYSQLVHSAIKGMLREEYKI